MKLKIIKARESWWYSMFVGKEFEIIVGYYKNGYNHTLKFDSLEQLQENINRYGGTNLYYFTDSLLRIHLENTNYKQLIRKQKLEKLNET